MFKNLVYHVNWIYATHIILKETNIIQSLAQKIDCMYAAERCTSNQNQANNILGDKQ